MKDKGVSSIDIAETNELRRNTVTQHTDLKVIDPLNQPPVASSNDVVFDAVGGAATRQSSIEVINPGGVVVHIGLMDSEGAIDVRRMTLQEITFIGCYT